MKLKNIFSKVVAIFSIVTLLFGAFQVSGFDTQAATESEREPVYEMVTLSDLTDNYAPGTATTSTGIMFAKQASSTWAGAIFEGEFIFSTTGESNMILLGNSSTANNNGLKIFLKDAGTIQVRFLGEKGTTDRILDDYIAASNVGIDTYVDTPLKLKIQFDFANYSADETTADVTVAITVNDQYAITLTKTTFPLQYMNRAVRLFGKSTQPLSYAAVDKVFPSNLIEVTPADFGIEDKCYAAENQTSLAARGVKGELSDKYNTGKKMTLDGKFFSAQVRFTGTNSSISIGGTDINSWLGFSFTRTSTGFLFTSNDSENWCTMPQLDIVPTQAGLLSADEAFHLKISCEFEDSDRDGTDDCIKFGIWIKDKLYNNTYVYTENLPSDMGCGAFIICKTEGSSVDIVTEEQVRDDITPYILEEFGIETQTYTEEQHYTKDLSAYSANSVRGNISLIGNAWASIYASNTNVGRGIRFRNTGGKLECYCLIRNSADSANNTYFSTVVEEVAAGETFSFELTKEVLDLDMSGTPNDVRIGIWINGTLHNKQYYYLLDCADKFGETVNLAAASDVNSITVQDSVEVESYNLVSVEGYEVKGIGDLFVNDEACTNGQLICNPGDYIVRSAIKGSYVKYIACYYPGDAKPDGEIDICDLIATKKAALNINLSTKAGNLAADNNGDNRVDNNDCTDLRTKLLTGANIKK